MSPRLPLICLCVILIGFLLISGCENDPVSSVPLELAPNADHRPPRVEVIYPFTGDTLSGEIEIIVSATDKYGVDSVEFFIDGLKQAGGTDTTEPYLFTWNTRFSSNGPHTVHARATDTSENSAVSDTILVFVANELPPEERRVVVLVIDGARYTETFGDPFRANVPFMNGYLRPQGTLFSDFRNEGITSTNPGHASIESGTWQNIPNDGSERPTLPTFFEYFRSESQLPQSKTCVVVGKAKLDICTFSIHSEYGALYGATEDAADRSDENTFQALIGHLEAEQPKLVLVNLADVDRAGHAGVWDNYITAIQTADSLVYELWQYLEGDEFYGGKTYLFVTNDHGRHTTDFRSHGDSCEGCEHIMCLVLGPHIKRGHTIAETRTMRDLCPTIGSILDFPSPYAVGSPITAIFNSGPTGIALTEWHSLR